MFVIPSLAHWETFERKQALRWQWFAGVIQVLLPITISEEESNSFCGMHAIYWIAM
jgi:hypothetical protein